MQKKSKKLGKNILNRAEIQNISAQGIWILVHGHEYFMSFKEFPWFLKATIEQIYDLQLFHEKHLHWPSLDVDVDLDSLKHLEAYPLIYS